MLRCGILSVIRSSSIQTSRFYRDRKVYSGDQAGFRRQKEELGDLFVEEPEIDYEADFNELPTTMREHKQEMQRQKEKITLKMIEKKYFRTTKLPSFLTWAEKEQIRHLNQQDPDEWNVQRLSESFPATEDAIVKILKAKWTPNDMKRVRSHDESIKRNWQAFKANKLKNLDPELKEHLARFSQRNFNSKNNAYAASKNDQIEFKFPKPKHREFSHIISSCKPLAKAKEIAENASERIEAGESGRNVIVSEEKLAQKIELPKKLRLRNIRLDELQKEIKIDDKKTDEDDFHIGFQNEKNSVKSLNKQGNVNRAVGLDDYEEIDLNYSQHSKETSDIVSAVNESEAQIVKMSPAQKIKKYVGKEVSAKSMTNSNDLEPIMDKIVIPPEARKEGAMYKVNDCFYDDKGYFLFKVPGLDSVWY